MKEKEGSGTRERGGYSRFPISNCAHDDIDSPADGGEGDDDGAAAAVCSARQDSERNSRLRQKSWEPNSSRCCRTLARTRKEEEGKEAVYLQQASGQELPPVATAT